MIGVQKFSNKKKGWGQERIQGLKKSQVSKKFSVLGKNIKSFVVKDIY